MESTEGHQLVLERHVSLGQVVGGVGAQGLHLVVGELKGQQRALERSYVALGVLGALVRHLHDAVDLDLLLSRLVPGMNHS